MSAVLDTHAAIFERIVHELAQDNPAFGVFPLDYNVASALRSIPCGVVPDMPDRIIAATGPLADERRLRAARQRRRHDEHQAEAEHS